MARVTKVLKARKDIPGTDIKKGDTYYWWQFRYGGRHTSKTYPKRSQTTQSAFYASLWDIEDEDIAKLPADDTLKDACENIAESLRNLGEGCQNSLDNMPEGLKEGSTGQMLQERIDGLETAAGEFDNLDFDSREENETDEEFWERMLGEAQGISIEVP